MNLKHPQGEGAFFVGKQAFNWTGNKYRGFSFKKFWTLLLLSYEIMIKGEKNI